jgi:hypothetical protein
MVLFSANPFSSGGLATAGLLRPQLHNLSCTPVSIRENRPAIVPNNPTVVLTAARRDGSQPASTGSSCSAFTRRHDPFSNATAIGALPRRRGTPRHAQHLPMRAAAMKLFGLYLAITYAVYFGFL